MTKRLALAIVAVPLAVFLASSGATWATGSSADPVLGSALVGVTGTQGAPAAVAHALPRAPSIHRASANPRDPMAAAEAAKV